MSAREVKFNMAAARHKEDEYKHKYLYVTIIE